MQNSKRFSCFHPVSAEFCTSFVLNFVIDSSVMPLVYGFRFCSVIFRKWRLLPWWTLIWELVFQKLQILFLSSKLKGILPSAWVESSFSASEKKCSSFSLSFKLNVATSHNWKSELCKSSLKFLCKVWAASDMHLMLTLASFNRFPK